MPDSVVFYLPFIIKIFVMKKIVFAFLAMISILSVNAQSGEKNLQKRQVSGFHGVDVSGGIDLYLSYGPESVAVSAASTEVRDHIITEVDGWNPADSHGEKLV